MATMARMLQAQSQARQRVVAQGILRPQSDSRAWRPAVRFLSSNSLRDDVDANSSSTCTTPSSGPAPRKPRQLEQQGRNNDRGIQNNSRVQHRLPPPPPSPPRRGSNASHLTNRPTSPPEPSSLKDVLAALTRRSGGTTLKSNNRTSLNTALPAENASSNANSQSRPSLTDNQEQFERQKNRFFQRHGTSSNKPGQRKNSHPTAKDASASSLDFRHLLLSKATSTSPVPPFASRAPEPRKVKEPARQAHRKTPLFAKSSLPPLPTGKASSLLPSPLLSPSLSSKRNNARREVQPSRLPSAISSSLWQLPNTTRNDNTPRESLLSSSLSADLLNLRKQRLENNNNNNNKAASMETPGTGEESLSDMLGRWRFSAASVSATSSLMPPPLPLSDDPNSLRALRQRNKNRQMPPSEDFSDFLNKKTGVKNNNAAAQDDGMSAVVTIPHHALSLTEASLLFRIKADSLRQTLGHLDELTPTNAHLTDDVLRLDPDVLELLALERGVDCVRATRRRGSTAATAALLQEDAATLLLQRRTGNDPPVAAVAAATTTALTTEAHLLPRPPVVTIMGHVDHGKTTLMDALRRYAKDGRSSSSKSKTKQRKKAPVTNKAKNDDGDVAGTEAGGITQVISAFEVPLMPASNADDHGVGTVTFLDTPGHAAFKAMRQSGSEAADIIVLVVAADDGIATQTIEILNFYKSIVQQSQGGISLVVAMNKIDKPGIQVEEARRRIESQLMEHAIFVEGMPSADASSEYGPPVQLIPVSALTGEGLEDLVEGLALQSEVMDLRADGTARAEGIVMDARVEKGLGTVVDCIVRWGSMQKGDVLVSGTDIGRVRMLKDVKNKALSQGGPSQPVRIVGFESVPRAGDPVICVASEEVAEELVRRRKAVTSNIMSNDVKPTVAAELQSSGNHMMVHGWKEKLEDKSGIEQGVNVPIRIPIIVRADADGTLAAVRDCLVGIGETSAHNLYIDPVKQGVGPVLAADIQMARECNATIVSFNVKNEQLVVNMAGDEGVAFLRNDVIYRLLEDAKEQFANYLPAVPTEVVHGKAQVKAIFAIGGNSDKVAGLQVLDGTIYKAKTPGKKNQQLLCEYRVVRDGVMISEGAYKATSLKHFKEDVEEISRGNECGLSLAGFSDFQEGDVVECFSIEMKRVFV